MVSQLDTASIPFLKGAFLAKRVTKKLAGALEADGLPQQHLCCTVRKILLTAGF